MKSTIIGKSTKSLRYVVAVVAASSILWTSEQLIWPQAAAQQTDFSDEKVVHLLEEPRHRTVHNEGNLYLLDVQVNPGDTSFAHIHDQPILLTSISSGGGPSNGNVRAIPEYYNEPLTHKVSNDGPGLLRIIALVNGGNGVNGGGDAPSGIERDPDVINPWFRSYRLELGPGEQTEMQTHNNHTIVVQGSSGLVHVTREDGVDRELASAGDWAWRKPGSSFLVKNMGSSPVIVAINEGRE